MWSRALCDATTEADHVRARARLAAARVSMQPRGKWSALCLCPDRRRCDPHVRCCAITSTPRASLFHAAATPHARATQGASRA